MVVALWGLEAGGTGKMSVQIIENWSGIRGVVLSCSPSPVAGSVAAEVKANNVKPAEGFANLLGQAEGNLLLLLVPQELAESLEIAPGDTIGCRVRRASLDRTFVHRNFISVNHSG
jgi:hypothetical protein